MTNNPEQRIIEHYLNQGKENFFTGRYLAYYLVYYESSPYIRNIIAREKKTALVHSFNPQWKFLNEELFGRWPPEELIAHRGS